MAKDPVCGMTVDEKAAATSETGQRLQRKGVDEHEK
jgi:hypothetical protein